MQDDRGDALVESNESTATAIATMAQRPAAAATCLHSLITGSVPSHLILHYTMVFPSKFPPVKSDATVDDCLRSLRASDYLQWTGATAGSWAYGFLVGRPARFGMANLMAGIGFTFGSFVVLQNSRGRLMGFRENAREHKLFQTGVEPGSPGITTFKPDLDYKQFN